MKKIRKKKETKLRKMSFKIRLIIIIELVVLIINSVLGYFIWYQLSEATRENSKNRLIAIASSAATLVDPEKHEKIQVEEDEEAEEYQEIRKAFQKLTKANDKVDDIYTIRKLEDGWVFVVGGHETGDDNGDGKITEDEESVGINEKFDISDIPEVDEVKNGSVAENDLNCDKWGCWLSGYAPFYDKDGNFVGAAAVDIAADDIVAFERMAKISIAAIILALLIIFPIVIYFFLSKVVRPISLITSGLSDFGRNFSRRIEVKSGDEFELIANTFNKMASELEVLYKNLEKKVREKTKALALKMKETELEKAKDEALLESLGEGMIATDQEGKIILINHQAEILLGYRASEVIGRNYSTCVKMLDEKGKEVEPKKRPDFITLKTGQKFSGSSYYYARKDSVQFPVHITSSPVVLNSEINGMVLVFRNITEEKQVDIAKTEIVSMASHQLRTPLAGVSWYVELMMEDKKLTTKQRGYLLKIYNSNQKMVDLVESLLNVSRIELGTFVINNEQLDVSEFLSNLADEFVPMIDLKKTNFSLELDPDLGLFNVDGKLLRIILQNLISNAIKYTPEKGNVRLKARREAGKVIFEVIDNGLGIPKSQQNMIFSKLFRADNVKDVVTEGTGLGLYLIKMIVDHCGGKISFESERDKGTTFIVELPESGMEEKSIIKNIE